MFAVSLAAVVYFAGRALDRGGPINHTAMFSKISRRYCRALGMKTRLRPESLLAAAKNEKESL